MKSKLYRCWRYAKYVKSTSDLTRHINTWKILITLPYYQVSKLELLLLDLPSDNNKKNFKQVISNNIKKKIRPADIKNNNKDIKLANVNKQRPADSNLMPWNRLLSKSSLMFGEIIFRKSEFWSGTLVLDIEYEHFESQNNNLFDPFSD